MMDFDISGLTELQRDLLDVAQNRLPRESYKIMRKVGSKARTAVAKEARSRVEKKSGNYHKRFKRGKAFKDPDGQFVVRVINSAPHAHLIEHGHRLVRGGVEVGFVTGKKVLEQGIQKFDNSGQYEKMIADWLDDLLRDGKL